MADGHGVLFGVMKVFGNWTELVAARRCGGTKWHRVVQCERVGFMSRDSRLEKKVCVKQFPQRGVVGETLQGNSGQRIQNSPTQG